MDARGDVVTKAPIAPRVELLGIGKSFGDVHALTDVTLSILPGRVHALLGENGAGKSTLMRILYGLTSPDRGDIRVDGKAVSIVSPRVARAHGIGMVTQHFALVGPLTVAENLALTSGRNGFLSARDQRQRVRELSAAFGLDVDPDARVDELPVGARQRVEILKALGSGSTTLVLDEPTAVLAPTDVASLFALVRGLCRDAALSVVFISHKMHEVLDISDDVSVLRQGRIVSTQPNTDLDVGNLTRLMIGHDSPADEMLVGAAPPERLAPAEHGRANEQPILRVRDVRVERDGVAVVDAISFVVHPGEVVGVAGVTGNGQTELVAALLGTREPDAGSVEVSGREVTGSGVLGRRSAGLAGISEDRHDQIVGELSVTENLALAEADRYRRGLALDRAAMTAQASSAIEHFAIKATPGQAAGTLSGGNMQKVLLARMFQSQPRAVVVAQPTRGLDVASTAQVRQELVAGSRAGTAVLVISEDLDEVVELADRVLVLYRGAIVGDLAGAEISPERIGRLMAGVGEAP